MSFIPAVDVCQRPDIYAPLPLRCTLIDPQGEIVTRLQERFSRQVAAAGLWWDVKLWPQALLLWGDIELLRLAFLRLGHFAVNNSRDGGRVALEFIERGRMAECSLSFVEAAASQTRERPYEMCAVDLCRRRLQSETRPDLCVARYVAEAHGGWLWSDRSKHSWTRVAMTLPEHTGSGWSVGS